MFRKLKAKVTAAIDKSQSATCEMARVPVTKLQRVAQESRDILRNSNGLEAFEIVIGVIVAVVLGGIVLAKNKDLFNNTVWPKVTDHTTDLLS